MAQLGGSYTVIYVQFMVQLGGSYTVIYVQFMAQLGGGGVIQLYMYSSWYS